jgi:hypothetical protein
MLKSYYCLSYHFTTKDDGRVIHLRLLLHTEHKNVHKCNSKLIIAISETYNFIEYTMDYLSNAHLDKCGAEDKINRYGYRYPVQSNPIKIDLHHYSIDNKADHPYFNYIEDTFNTLEESEILSVKSGSRIESVKAIEITGKYTVARLDFPPIRLYNLAE